MEVMKQAMEVNYIQYDIRGVTIGFEEDEDNRPLAAGCCLLADRRSPLAMPILLTAWNGIIITAPPLSPLTLLLLLLELSLLVLLVGCFAMQANPSICLAATGSTATGAAKTSRTAQRHVRLSLGFRLISLSLGFWLISLSRL